MVEYIIILLLLICVVIQARSIYLTKQQEKEWLDTLKSIKQGRATKLFTKRESLISELNYELNEILENYTSEITLLRKSEKANQKILTSLSHDVRTPLTSLLGYLEALNNGIASEKESKQYVEVAYRKAGDLKSFVDMLFEWCKINSNEQTLFFEVVDINELTREILIEWLPIFEQQRTALNINIPNNELQVNLDKMSYTRILNNLFQNAINHSDGESIFIDIETIDDYIQIQVANDGSYIPSDKLPFIFDRLYKCDDARSEKGSGLGLAITKELVQALHGKISVQSSPENHTVFTVILPLVK